MADSRNHGDILGNFWDKCLTSIRARNGNSGRSSWRFLPAAIVLLSSLCLGQVTNLTVVGATRTSATITYTCPDAAAATIAASTVNADPVVNTVNDLAEGQFTGSSSDQRTYSQGVQWGGFGNTGTSRQFTIGSPITAQNSSGIWVSRALQNFTTYYVTVTCTGGHANTSFTTDNVKWGIAMWDVPYNTSQTAGTQALLDMTTFWDNTQKATATLIEPLTGTLMRPVTGANDFNVIASGGSYIGSRFGSVGLGTNWTNTVNAYSNDGASFATYAGTTQDKLFLHYAHGTFSDSPLPDYFRLYITGNADGSGDNAKASVCWTLDGTTCYTTTHDFTLPASTGSANYPSSAPNGVDLTSWGQPIILSGDIVNNANFGILVWKKGTGTGTINLQFPKFDIGMDFPFGTTTEGGYEVCSPSPRNDSTGHVGYICGIAQNGNNRPAMYWISRDTGEARFVADIYIDRAQIPTDFTGGTGAFAVQAGNYAWDSSGNFYIVVNNSFGHNAVLKMTPPATGSTWYDTSHFGLVTKNGGSVPAGTFVWANLSPESTSTCGASGTLPCHLGNQLAQFDSTFDFASYSCVTYFVTSDNLVTLNCRRGQQNSYGWLAAFDPTGATPSTRIAGAFPMWTKPGATFCAEHSLFYTDVAGVIQDQVHDLDGSSTGQGPYQTTLVSCDDSPYPSTTCTDSTHMAASANDTTITVAAEPTSAHADTTIPLYTTAANDLFLIGTEFFYIKSKSSATQWVVARAQFGSAAASHAATAVVKMRCGLSQLTAQNEGGIFWNIRSDPHGNALSLDFGANLPQPPFWSTGFTGVGNHQGTMGGYRVASKYASCPTATDYVRCGSGTGSTYAISVAPSVGPGWQVNCQGNNCQSHPSPPMQAANVAAARKPFGFDWAAYNNGGAFTQPNLVLVSGSLYKLSLASSTYTQGSNLTSISVSSNVATVTTAANSQVTGDEIIISGATTTPAINGIYAYSTHVSSTQFTITTSGIGNGAVTLDSGMTVRILHNHPDYLPQLVSGVVTAQGTGSLGLKMEMPFLDVSGPSSSIGGTSSDNYKYCVVHVAGECFAGSVVGDLFVNSPNLSASSACAALTGVPPVTDFCYGDWPGYYGQAAIQLRVDRTESSPLWAIRQIAYLPAPMHYGSISGTVTPLPDASHTTPCLWALTGVSRRERSDVISLCVPTEPADDASINRHNFVTLTASPSTVALATHTYIQWGRDPGYFCHTRVETCIQDTATYDQTRQPWKYLSEVGNGVDCSAACSFQIPARPGDTIFWRPVYRKTDNTLISTGAMHIALADPAGISVSVSPNPNTQTTSSQATYTATVTGDPNNLGVTWGQSCTAGTGNGITAGGVFTAPNAAATCTLTATSVADGTKSGTATVVVSTPVDTTPPTVAITSPSAGDNSGTVSFTATCTDAVGCTSVTLSIDGATFGSPIAAPGPYTLSLDLGTISPGTHTLGATGSDAAGNIGTASTVTINNVSPPVISLFDCTPTFLNVGGQTSCSWVVNTAASTCSIDHGVGAVPCSSSANISPATQTTYTFTATNAAGNVTSTTTISVGGGSQVGGAMSGGPVSR